MKLLTKTTLYYITISLFIFFILGIGVYQLVKRLEDRKVNQELEDQKLRFSHDLTHVNVDLQNTTIVSGGLIQLFPVDEMQKPFVEYSDTVIFDPIRSSYIPYRRLSYYLQTSQGLFKMSIFKSLFESNYLIEQVALVITSTIVLFLLTVYFLYRYSFAGIWADFFQTIDKIKHFNLSSPEKLDFPQSMIIEFNQLNDVLKKMIDRISTDFQGLREFSGNLTHEVQTPLAVIRSKADLMLQDRNCTENQMQLATEINSETVRLSKLIKALSLFTKLDHNLFSAAQFIDLEQLIKAKLEFFDDFIEARHLTVECRVISKPDLQMSAELADILFVNLVKNAIRHNIEYGKIEIIIDKNSFRIKNTGQNMELNTETLFERFSKLSKTSESLGIGLSLAKKICTYYQFKIEYLHHQGIHELIVEF